MNVHNMQKVRGSSVCIHECTAIKIIDVYLSGGGVGDKLTHCRHRYAELAVMGAIRRVPARGVSTGQRAAGGQVSEPVSISSLLWIRVVAM